MYRRRISHAASESSLPSLLAFLRVDLVVWDRLCRAKCELKLSSTKTTSQLKLAQSSNEIKCFMRVEVGFWLGVAWLKIAFCLSCMSSGKPTISVFAPRFCSTSRKSCAAWLRFLRNIGSRGKIMPSIMVASPMRFSPISQAMSGD